MNLPYESFPYHCNVQDRFRSRGLVRHPEPAHVHETQQPQFLVMPTHLADTVETAHGIFAGLDWSLQFVQVPAPEHRDDKDGYAPLVGLTPARRLRPQS